MMNATSQTEVYDVSSCSILSQYETNGGMKMLMKMGQQGGGLGINWEGVTQPLEAVRRQPFEGLGYGCEEKGDCSEVSKEKAISSPSDSNQGIKPHGSHQLRDNGRYKPYSNSSFAHKEK